MTPLMQKRGYDATAAYKASKQANRMLTKSASAELFAPGAARAID